MKIPVPALGSLLLCLGGLLAFAHYRWREKSAGFVARVMRGPVASQSGAVAAVELEGLPAPVMRYFRAVLRDGQPIVRHVRLRQRGDFLVRPAAGGWRPFSATQHVSTQPAGFVWDARIRMAPGLDIRVRDAFVAGTGSMLASVLGLFPLVSVVLAFR